MAFCDLHLHSTASDGTLAPAQLVEQARSLGLSTIALTDHDTIDGCPEAIDHGHRVGIRVIPGVEINTELDGHEIHILGYGFADGEQNLQALLSEMREDRRLRMVKMVEGLRQCGFTIAVEEVFDQAQGGAVGRPHLARLMVDKGFVASVPQAFAEYLSPGQPAYVSRCKLLPEQAIQAIHRAGAVSVLAHPGLLADQRVIDTILAAGVAGIEAYHSEHSPSQTNDYLRLAQERGLLVTGGSDYHGPAVKSATMGQPQVPDALAARLVRAIEIIQSTTGQFSERMD